jgi:hypothetical protein
LPPLEMPRLDQNAVSLFVSTIYEKYLALHENTVWTYVLNSAPPYRLKWVGLLYAFSI